MIPYGRQDVRDSDIEAVVEILRSDFLTQGPTVPRFEELVARRVGATYAIAVNSATSALHIACLALELGPDDVFSILLDPSRTFADFGKIEFTPIEKTAAEAIHYYQQHGTLGEYTHLSIQKKE